MNIIDKVRERKEAMRVGNDKTAAQNKAAVELAAENQRKAIAALFGGLHSRAWEDYMSEFAENTAQLMRLKATDGTINDSDMHRRRAYLVANAICGSTTVGGFDNWVDTIDEGLDPEFKAATDTPKCDTPYELLQQPASSA